MNIKKMRFVNVNGDDLKRIRTSCNKTMTQMGELMSVDRKTIQNWENGVGQPKGNQLFTLMIAAGFDFTAIINQLSLLKNSDKGRND